jgi:DUF4097 and DUF4098 domain-containing protein YvlB
MKLMTLFSPAKKKIYLLLMCLAGLFSLSLSVEAGQTGEKIIPVSNDPTLIIRSQSGWITIKSWARPEVRVAYTQYSSNVEVDIDQTKEKSGKISKIQVATHVLDNLAPPEMIKVDYLINTPELYNLEIRTNLGGIMVEPLQLKGKLVIDVVDAAVKLVGVNGSIDLRSVCSRMEITESGGTIQTHTVSGDIAFSRLTSRDVIAKTTNGNVFFDGAFLPNGNYDLSSTGGLIQIHCSEKESVEWNARTDKGVIESDLPIRSKNHSSVPYNKVGRQSLLGTLNSGESTVRLETFSGKIKIMKK